MFHLLEITAITHDIGIKLSEQKYGSADGKYQEQEGPAEAEKLLTGLGFDEDFIDKVCYLIANHHTYKGIDNKVHQILVEADFLVNIYDDHISPELAKSVKQNIFRTESGIRMFEHMYGYWVSFKPTQLNSLRELNVASQRWIPVGVEFASQAMSEFNSAFRATEKFKTFFEMDKISVENYLLSKDL